MLPWGWKERVAKLSQSHCPGKLLPKLSFLQKMQRQTTEYPWPNRRKFIKIQSAGMMLCLHFKLSATSANDIQSYMLGVLSSHTDPGIPCEHRNPPRKLAVKPHGLFPREPRKQTLTELIHDGKKLRKTVSGSVRSAPCGKASPSSPPFPSVRENGFELEGVSEALGT